MLSEVHLNSSQAFRKPVHEGFIPGSLFRGISKYSGQARQEELAVECQKPSLQASLLWKFENLDE